MGDYIEREAALLSLTPIVKRASERNRNIRSAVNQCVDAINFVPAADVRPVVRAKWKRNSKKENGVYIEWCECSACRETATAGASFWDNETPFCPWCGADMRTGEE